MPMLTRRPQDEGMIKSTYRPYVLSLDSLLTPTTKMMSNHIEFPAPPGEHLQRALAGDSLMMGCHKGTQCPEPSNRMAHR
jgi:hypothetical protein